jgi:hypothetical protein
VWCCGGEFQGEFECAFCYAGEFGGAECCESAWLSLELG